MRDNISPEKGCFTSAEQTPRELIDVCLECKRMACNGECARYSEALKEYKKSIGIEVNSARKPQKRHGYEPKRYEYHGAMMSVPEVSEATGIAKTTLRTWLRRGLTMEETVERYERKIQRRNK
jgi:hypothetical protein